MRSLWLLAPAALVASTSGYATTYLTTAQAQAVLFPGARLASSPVELTSAQRKAIEFRSGVRVPTPRVLAWRAQSGGWFIVDHVIGKHDTIAYAVGLDSRGAVRGIEILAYRESYGGEVRYPRWRRQFLGKTSSSPLKLGGDIKNISGATLSCRHVTEGVKRILATYAVVLSKIR